MESENDEFEQEEDDFEEEIQEPKVKTSKVKEIKENKPEEKYVAFYQEQRIGIVNTITGEIEVEGLENPAIAKLEAIKLNKLDKIAITTGVQ